MRGLKRKSKLVRRWVKRKLDLNNLLMREMTISKFHALCFLSSCCWGLLSRGSRSFIWMSKPFVIYFIYQIRARGDGVEICSCR